MAFPRLLPRFKKLLEHPVISALVASLIGTIATAIWSPTFKDWLFVAVKHLGSFVCLIFFFSTPFWIPLILFVVLLVAWHWLRSIFTTSIQPNQYRQDVFDGIRWEWIYGDTLEPYGFSRTCPDDLVNLDRDLENLGKNCVWTCRVCGKEFPETSSNPLAAIQRAQRLAQAKLQNGEWKVVVESERPAKDKKSSFAKELAFMGIILWILSAGATAGWYGAIKHYDFSSTSNGAALLQQCETEKRNLVQRCEIEKRILAANNGELNTQTAKLTKELEDIRLNPKDPDWATIIIHELLVAYATLIETEDQLYKLPTWNCGNETAAWYRTSQIDPIRRKIGNVREVINSALDARGMIYTIKVNNNRYFKLTKYPTYVVDWDTGEVSKAPN